MLDLPPSLHFLRPNASLLSQPHAQADHCSHWQRRKSRHGHSCHPGTKAQIPTGRGKPPFAQDLITSRVWSGSTSCRSDLLAGQHWEIAAGRQGQEASDSSSAGAYVLHGFLGKASVTRSGFGFGQPFSPSVRSQFLHPMRIPPKNLQHRQIRLVNEDLCVTE